MTEYTCEQINEEIGILKRTFPTVRLVNPTECRVMDLVGAKGGLSCLIGDTCYKTWAYPYQCANCISARALQTGDIQSKYEMQGDTLFHIVSRPISVNGERLALEIVQPIDGSDGLFPGTPTEITAMVQNRNRNLLRDEDTPAYNRRYLSEHLPNIMIEAAKTGRTNAALVRLKNLDDITEASGTVASSGLMRGLYDILQKTFCESDSKLLLVRYAYDTFFVYEGILDSGNFDKKLETLVAEDRPERVLFQNMRLPFLPEFAGVHIGEERVTSGAALLSLLEERLNTSYNR
ncbi:MAG: hypothetical protein ACI4AD_09310 [Roseburia sp.]